eukprot:5720626-Pyramimonas_sp.AAC.1
MGGDWCRWDAMAKRMRYLYLEVGKREEMERAWTQYAELAPADSLEVVIGESIQSVRALGSQE